MVVRSVALHGGSVPDDGGIMQSSHHQQLLRRLRDRTAVIGIAGLGYVGLPLAMSFREAGYRVIGFDNDPDKVASLNGGRSYIERIPASAIQGLRDGGFEATLDYQRGAEIDALIICVPTPLTRHQEPDLSFVLNTLDSFPTCVRVRLSPWRALPIPAPPTRNSNRGSRAAIFASVKTSSWCSRRSARIRAIRAIPRGPSPRYVAA
jgi:threonine dehydrogenase-like Zn-dependent dehydrogenase